MPFLKEADDMYLSRESNGQRIVYQNVYIYCRNAAHLVCDNETEEVVVLEEIPILQNEDGIDIEDRINKPKEYIRKYPKLC